VHRRSVRTSAITGANHHKKSEHCHDVCAACALHTYNRYQARAHAAAAAHPRAAARQCLQFQSRLLRTLGMDPALADAALLPIAGEC
jgi:hypothetical protein